MAGIPPFWRGLWDACCRSLSAGRGIESRSSVWSEHHTDNVGVGGSSPPGTTHGGLAQLARAPALQAGGHRFESGNLHYGRGGRGLIRESPQGRRFYDIMERTKQEYKSENTRTSKSTHMRSRQGRMGDALALGGEEGRDKLRKAAGRRKWPLIRGCPNGATQSARTIPQGRRTRRTETSK